MKIKDLNIITKKVSCDNHKIKSKYEYIIEPSDGYWYQTEEGMKFCWKGGKMNIDKFADKIDKFAEEIRDIIKNSEDSIDMINDLLTVADDMDDLVEKIKFSK